MSVRRSTTAYAAVRPEGGLLPPDLIDRVKAFDPDLGGLTAADYGLPESTRIDTEIAQAWLGIQTHYASFRRSMTLVDREGGQGTSETRVWVQQVLREIGYRELRFVARAETIADRSFLISHRAGDTENAPPVHIVSFLQDLDTRASRTGGGQQRSPQALMQGYLNASDHVWGVVTNGLVFRLLRENRQIDRILRVEFDLQSMLESENFADFRIFWLLLHRSRFVLPGERSETAWLERWNTTAADQGARALGGLRAGVERAIEALGQGLLAPDNAHLREKLHSGELTVDAYYSELLRLVYRLLFLMVAEERHLLFSPDADPQVVNRYQRYYSIDRLRNEAARQRHREQHHNDLWRGLLVTFDAMRSPKEAALLGLQPLGGGLFGEGSCPNVADKADSNANAGDRISGRPMLSNSALLDAVEALSDVTRDGVTRRVNYRDLDVEELGSVYEGLLEHRPKLEPLANGDYHFGFDMSTSRKETGSYYTPRSLVQELLNSALDPVIEQAIDPLRTVEDKRKALLDLNVCDPACGSGHFLLGASRRIGRRLAEIQAGEGNEPELVDIRHGVREAIRHCIYGVDKNPLAIDLCRTALWIESHEPGAPISFLDHHIKRGDSLVGVFDLEVLQQGIPDGAYKPVTGDDKKIAVDLKKRNAAERPKATVGLDGQLTTSRAGSLWDEDELANLVTSLAERLDEIEAMPDATIDDVKEKERAYRQLHGRDDWRQVHRACDLWTYAFFAPLTPADSSYVPTTATVRRMINKGGVSSDVIERATAGANSIGFFHWPLQFPEVHTRGGFDVLLANPPWERVKLQEKEFFAGRSEAIAGAANKAARTRLIEELEDDNPALLEAFHSALREAENASLFMRTSDRYPLTGRGDVNLYSVFAEHLRRLIAPTGRAGIIVPTGIATDDTNKFFFADVVNKASLAALYDFENRKKLFEAVDSRMKFSLITMAGSARRDARFDAAFFLLDPLEIHEPDKTFLLGAADIALLNPNTRTCPIFRSTRDAELTKAIYRTAPVLVDESKGEAGNPWGVMFKTMFHMSNDSHLFSTRKDLEGQGATLGTDGRFRKAGQEWLPLYEAKLIHQFDHRFATFDQNGNTRDVTVEEHAAPDFVVTPRYWVKLRDVVKAAGEPYVYLFGFRDITNSTNERTAITSVFPAAAVGNNLPIMIGQFSHVAALQGCIQANWSSVVFDFAARKKVGGTHINFFIAKQLPVLPPETYTQDLLDEIVPRVLELTYTAHDMAPFARDLGYDGPPFVWDEDRRAQLRAELDGVYAHLYGISREDFAYILDTFTIVRRKDIEAFGEYRTKRLCLEAYDWFAPETLRALEGEVRDLEIAFRDAISAALDGDTDQLPSHLREKLREEMAKNGRDPHDASLRELLDFSYFLDLEKIVRSEVVWAKLGQRFESKRQFERRFGAISKIRNPLAHGRSVPSVTRRDGEEALAWLRERLQKRSA